MGLWYSKDAGMSLTAYSDADQAGCQDIRRSTSGSAQFLDSLLDRKLEESMSSRNAKTSDMRKRIIKGGLIRGISIMTSKAQQSKLDNALVSPENRRVIGKCSMRINPGMKPKEPTYQVALDALALTTCYPAFLITVEVPLLTQEATKQARKTFILTASGSGMELILESEFLIKPLNTLGNSGEEDDDENDSKDKSDDGDYDDDDDDGNDGDGDDDDDVNNDDNQEDNDTNDDDEETDSDRTDLVIIKIPVLNQSNTEYYEEEEEKIDDEETMDEE
ncbi:hypothetical protein Tco_1042675 [Tanacetum coccineum]|uniref:Uncharacterized protein n=1 Tax=Tanacetum coccineum TaxID=301880 RepID=A0ABQ5GJS4_9ASTR